MLRAIFPLWRFWCVGPFILTFLAWAAVAIPDLPVLALPIIGIVSALMGAAFHRVPCRLCLHAIGCHTVRGRKLSIHCRSELLRANAQNALLPAVAHDCA